MKPVSEHFAPDSNQSVSPRAAEQYKAARARYLVVACLLAIVYALSNWNPENSAVSSFDFVTGIAVFWVAGGAITLGLLAFVARKRD